MICSLYFSISLYFSAFNLLIQFRVCELLWTSSELVSILASCNPIFFLFLVSEIFVDGQIKQTLKILIIVQFHLHYQYVWTLCWKLKQVWIFWVLWFRWLGEFLCALKWVEKLAVRDQAPNLVLLQVGILCFHFSTLKILACFNHFLIMFWNRIVLSKSHIVICSCWLYFPCSQFFFILFSILLVLNVWSQTLNLEREPRRYDKVRSTKWVHPLPRHSLCFSAPNLPWLSQLREAWFNSPTFILLSPDI